MIMRSLASRKCLRCSVGSAKAGMVSTLGPVSNSAYVVISNEPSKISFCHVPVLSNGFHSCILESKSPTDPE